MNKQDEFARRRAELFSPTVEAMIAAHIARNPDEPLPEPVDSEHPVGSAGYWEDQALAADAAHNAVDAVLFRQMALIAEETDWLREQLSYEQIEG